MANWASIDRLGNPADPAWQKKNLAWIEPVAGQKWQVYAPAAQAFEGLLGELAAQGYPLKSSGGFNYRNMRGSDKLSQHAFGTAIDLNADTNPMLARGDAVKTDLPANIGEIAKKYGLEWGGNWKRPDAMHFEYVGPSIGSQVAAQPSAPPQAPGTPAPTMPDPINVGTPPANAEQSVPTGLLASLGVDSAKANPILEAMGKMMPQQAQQPQMMQPMQAQKSMPALTDYLAEFLKSRMV